MSAKCTAGCRTCLNASTCSSCSAGFFFQADRLCHSTCPLRMFPNSTSQTCESCPYDCYTCNMSGACLSCNAAEDFRVLEGTRCVSLQGYYDNKITVSLKCPSTCATCSSPTACGVCLSGFYLRLDDMCYSTCPERYYADVLTRTCKACLYDCYTCSGPTACLSCNATTDHRALNATSNRCEPVQGYF
jgi:proprotein convertase subtilisin/kexin type 5